MRHPGGGARAQYTREYKWRLDATWRADAMSVRLRAAGAALRALRGGEARLAHTLARSTPPQGGARDAFTLVDLREHVARSRRALRKLAAALPPPPPVRWARMRSLEMGAYRRELRAFDKWDRRVAALEADAHVPV